jgi:hypothetical protein
MGILTAGDITSMRADVAVLIDDNPTSLAFRRGGSTLAAQTVRVEAKGQPSGAMFVNGTLVQRRGGCVLVGSITLDVEVEDRFTYQGELYRVNFVDPNRQICTQAEAYLDQ